MSHHGFGERERSSNRHGDPEYIHRSRSRSASRADRPEAHVEFDQNPNIPPPPRIYIRAPTDPAYAQPQPPQPGDYYDYGRRSHRQSANYANVGGEKSHGYVASPTHDDSGRMPSIQQNYRPPRMRPESHPEAYTIFTQMPDILHASTGQHQFVQTSHRRRDHITKIPPGHGVGGVGGDGNGGDIQTLAVQPAEAEPDTLNKIMICVYRNSKRRFVQREIWMMRPGHRNAEFSETSDLRKDTTFLKALRTDTAFFKEIKWRYKHQLRGTFKRYLSFKTVSTVRVLAVSNIYCYHLI
jgi:hypothetical protein